MNYGEMLCGYYKLDDLGRLIVSHFMLLTFPNIAIKFLSLNID